MIGQVLSGRYELVSLRGRGGMGEVYEAIDAADGSRVAIKVLVQEGGRPPQSLVSRFFREARATMALASPNVVRVFEAMIDPASNIPFMVMEYLDGEDLGQLLGRVGTVPQDLSVRIAAQACEGVERAHQAGIIHRDIKPANLFLSRSKSGAVTVKVLDFGIAKAKVEPGLAADTTGLTRSGSLIGSPLYMSPEQARGTRRVDHRSDIWSLGIVLYRCIAGRAPHQEITALGEFILALCAAPPKPLRHVAPWASEEVEAILMRALQIDPAARYTTAAAMRDALRALLPHGDALAHSAFADLTDTRMLLGLQRGDVATTQWITGPPRRSDAGTVADAARPPSGETPRPPSSTSPASPRPAKVRRALAALGFKNLTGRAESAWMSVAFAEMLSAEMAIGEEVRVIDGDQVARVAGPGPAPGEALASDALAEIGRALGADFVVTGSYLAIPRGDDVQLRLAASLQAIGSTSPLATCIETGTESDLIALVSRVGAHLRGALGVDENSIPSAPGPAFPEERRAMRFYAEGLERLRKLDLVQASELLERAVAVAPHHPLPRAALAEALLALGHERRAQEQARHAMARSGSLRREDRMFVEGRLHEVCKEWERAVDSYRALFAFFPDSVEYGLRLAESETQGGNGKAALATLAALRRLPPPASDDPRIELAEAAAAGSLSDYARCLDAAVRARRRAEAASARLLLGRARIAEADALVRLGRQADAAQACEEARRIFAEVGDRAGEGRAWNREANIAYEEGRFADAERMFGEALAIWQKLGHGSGVAQALNNIADSRLMQGRIAAARPLFEQAAAAAKNSGDGPKLGLILANLSDLCGRLGDLAAARHFGEQSLRTVRPIGYAYGLHAALSAIAVAALDAGDLPGAQAAFDETLASARTANDLRLVACSLQGLGQVRFERGDLDSARKLFDEALDLRVSGGFRADAAETWAAQARLELDERRPAEARALLARAGEAFRAAGMLENLALVEALALLAAAAAGEASEGLAAEVEAKLPQLEHATIRLLCMIGVAAARSAGAGVSAEARGSDGAGVSAEARGSDGVGVSAEARGSDGAGGSEGAVVHENAGAAASGSVGAGVYENARALLVRARDEAERLGLVPAACEARLALAKLEERAGRASVAAELRAEVEERGKRLGLGRLLRAARAPHTH